MPSKTIQSPRRGLNETEAAIYVGIGTTKFRELCNTKVMPAPKMVGTRRIWDIVQLDAAFDCLPTDGDNVPDSWADFHDPATQVKAR